MDVIKMEPESDSDTEPTLIEFESVNIKQEDPLVPLCTMKIALKDPYGVKRDPDSSAVETASFSTRAPVALKQEPQGDAQGVWDGSAMKQEQEDEATLQDYSIWSDGAELIVGTEDFIRSGVSVEHVDSQLGDDSGVSTVYVSQSKHSGKNSITSGVQHKSVVNKKPRTKPQRKMYQCDLCTRSFTRQGHVDEHRRTHTGEKPYECEICSKTFTQRGNLAQHLRTHSGDRPFKCDFCIKRFSQRTHLMEHRRIHTGEKPFICDMCNRGFSHQGHLVAHRRTHTVDKPFKCHLCKKRFSSSTYLLIHIRAHSGEKPHKCDSCDKSFMKHSDLVKHSLSHTDANPYKCEICHNCFPDQGNLTRHRRTHAESIHKYVSWKVSNNMEGTLSPALEGHLIDMQ